MHLFLNRKFVIPSNSNQFQVISNNQKTKPFTILLQLFHSHITTLLQHSKYLPKTLKYSQTYNLIHIATYGYIQPKLAKTTLKKYILPSLSLILSILSFVQSPPTPITHTTITTHKNTTHTLSSHIALPLIYTPYNSKKHQKFHGDFTVTF